ncbi:GNAT family N-acetyltransferase [Mesobacillus maritimus]|uniref:GNAT family N-acetyltransferase n=1 Tax=Mesobacillus maritimus TaxID=1643336 RepID=UPI00384EACC5
MNIRKLGVQDAENYLKIRLTALKNNPEAFGSSFEEEKDRPVEMYEQRLSSEESITYGAFLHNQLVGTVTLMREKYVKFRHRASIVGMYVDPENRGSGIGRLLLIEAINQAKTIGEIEQLNLSVVTTNEPAKKLYTSLGFEVFGTEKRALKLDERSYLDEHHMVLFL